MSISRSKRRSVKKQVSPNQARPSDLTIKRITPLTDNQALAFENYDNGHNIFLHGSAGTGKSFLALYLALETLQDSKIYDKIVIIRSTVPSRDMGFLPGSLADKAKVYEEPYIDICNNLCGRGDAYSILKQKGTVVFTTTSFLRGITCDNSIIILDEVQNCTDAEINTVLTRVGNNCRIIVCGDFHQTDLNKKYDSTGVFKLLDIVKTMPNFDITEFTVDDIVRSGFVKQYLIARNHYEANI